MHQLNLPLIQKAAAFLKGKILRTPVEFSPVLSDLLKVPVYLKLEFLQLTGSFKSRGALFYLSTLHKDELKTGSRRMLRGESWAWRGLCSKTPRRRLHDFFAEKRGTRKARENQKVSRESAPIGIYRLRRHS